MTTALEIVSGLVLSGAFLTMVTTLAALELGRLVTRDEDQREVETRRAPRLGPDHWTPSVRDGRRRPGPTGRRTVRARGRKSATEWDMTDGDRIAVRRTG